MWHSLRATSKLLAGAASSWLWKTVFSQSTGAASACWQLCSFNADSLSDLLEIHFLDPLKDQNFDGPLQAVLGQSASHVPFPPCTGPDAGHCGQVDEGFHFLEKTTTVAFSGLVWTPTCAPGTKIPNFKSLNHVKSKGHQLSACRLQIPFVACFACGRSWP